MLNLKSNMMMGFTAKTIFIAIFLAMISLNFVQAVDGNSQYSDLPPPPPKPERFTSKQQLKEYLVKLHEYYAIIGRPRFGRSYPGHEAKHSLSALIFPSLSNIQLQETDLQENEYQPQSSETPNELSVPNSLIIELIDSNNNGLTSREELLNFIKNFNKKL